MNGSEAINDYSCVRDRISFSDRAEDLVQFKCSVFFLFVHLGVSIQSWHNQQRMCCVLFQKPSDEEKFFPREINRELMLFWTSVIDTIFLHYLSLWILLAYACISDHDLQSALFSRSSLSLQLFHECLKSSTCKSKCILERVFIRMWLPFIKQFFK